MLAIFMQQSQSRQSSYMHLTHTDFRAIFEAYHDGSVVKPRDQYEIEGIERAKVVTGNGREQLKVLKRGWVWGPFKLNHRLFFSTL